MTIETPDGSWLGSPPPVLSPPIPQWGPYAAGGRGAPSLPPVGLRAVLTIFKNENNTEKAKVGNRQL